jgi:hypothetical protein
MLSKGYVALFSQPLTRGIIEECVQSWLDRFEKVEQVTSQNGGIGGLSVEKVEEIVWENQLQFRILNGGDFTWVYATLNKRGMETTGMPNDNISLCLDVLTELPYVIEIIDEHDDQRLDQLEDEDLI